MDIYRNKEAKYWNLEPRTVPTYPMRYKRDCAFDIWNFTLTYHTFYVDVDVKF